MNLKKNYKGILLCLVIAIPCWFLGKKFPIVGGPVFGIILGMIITLFIKDKKDLQSGITFTSKKILQYAVILLGFGMNLSVVLQTGKQSLPIILVTISTSLIVSYVLHKAMKIPSKISTLIGVGSSICGGSAIAAASPILEAKDEDIALSISTIFFFNILAVFIFPFLGHLMHMNDATFGTWAGTAINDTSSVVAAGYTYSQSAGDLATIVKLSRALMIVPACLIFAGVRYVRSQNSHQKVDLKKIFPWFILWFVVASIVTSVGIFPSSLVPATKFLSQWLMAMALAGIGARVSFGQFRKAGAAPLLTGAFAWFAVAVSSLIIQYFFS